MQLVTPDERLVQSGPKRPIIRKARIAQLKNFAYDLEQNAELTANDQLPSLPLTQSQTLTSQRLAGRLGKDSRIFALPLHRMRGEILSAFPAGQGGCRAPRLQRSAQAYHPATHAGTPKMTLAGRSTLPNHGFEPERSKYPFDFPNARFSPIVWGLLPPLRPLSPAAESGAHSPVLVQTDL
jgi:hypothetical protein